MRYRKYPMQKFHHSKAYQILVCVAIIYGAITGSTRSSPDFQHKARLAVVNKTPYMISYDGRYAPKDNTLWLDLISSSDNPRHERIFVGGVRANKSGMEQVEGRFSFMLKDAQGGNTDEKFELDFVIKKNDDAGTFARLQTRTPNPATGNLEVEPYSMVSMRMSSKNCNREDPLIQLRTFSNACIFTLYMSSDASWCHKDPDCNAREYSRQLNASQKRDRRQASSG